MTLDHAGTDRMIILDFARVFLQHLPVGVVVTDPRAARPGPVIVYANAAFAELVGRDLDEMIGLTPRFMQGRETLRSSLDVFGRALAAGERFHGYLTNYKADGRKYRAEIDCRPLRGADGRVEYFIAFQREVVRRLGRPSPGRAGRYEPVEVSNDLLTDPLRALGVFVETEPQA